MKRMTLKMMAEDFGKTALNLGRADENKAVRIEIDLSNLLEIAPDANASVTVETPSGKKYPATTSKEGKLLIWDVNSADTAEEGRGLAQLTITGSNDEVLKSVVTATSVGRSIRGDGPAPDPVQNWVDDATRKLGNVVSAGENAKEAASKAEEAAKRANDAAEKAENGGVQSDYTQNDATQPDYIKNRPGGYYQTVPGVNITWDGVIGDRPKALLDDGMYLVKVSNEILTADRVIGATAVSVRGAESQSWILSEDQIMSGDGFMMANNAILSCSKTTVEMGGGILTFPETGTYFGYVKVDGMYVSSLTKPGTQELVPIPGELTNIKGGYDLPDKTEELYNGTITADSWAKQGESSQLKSVSAWAVVEPFVEAPIALAVELIDGATITGTVAGVKVSGTVDEGSARLFSQVTRASAGGAGGRLVCKITKNSIQAGSAPETDIDVQLIQRVEGGPVLVPAEYLDTTALETDIGNAQTTANSAQTTAIAAQIAANNAQTTANNAQTAVTSEIRTNNLCFRSPGTTNNQTTDIPSNLGVKIGNMYKSSTGMQYYPVSLTANDGLQFSADTSNPTETHVHLYTEKSNNVISGILELHDNYGNFMRIRPDSITAYRLTFENGIIIRSSTAGSTKKYKITVDDAGTLSATEVTS